MLPADVARCPGTGCPNRDACLRYTDRSLKDHPRVVWMAPPPQVFKGEACPAFIPAICYGDSCIMTHEKARSAVPLKEDPDA